MSARDSLFRAIERWNAGDLAGYLGLYADDAILHGTPDSAPGIAGIRSRYSRFWDAAPGASLAPEDILSDGDKIAWRFVVHAAELERRAISILRFRGGQCVERWDAADYLKPPR